MATQPKPTENEMYGIQPARYSEMRTPGFQGGAVDPESGNIVSGSRLDASRGQQVQQVSEQAPKPQSRLGEIEAPSEMQALGQSAGQTAATFLGGNIGAKLGAGFGAETATKATLGEAAGTLGLSSAAKMPGPKLPGIADAGRAGLTSAGNLAGGALAGLGTFAVGMLTGQDFKESAKSGVGAGVGFAIGNAVLPGIGGFVGSFLGSLFCYAKGTRIIMADGTMKPVEEIKLLDEVLLGGRVLGTGMVLSGEIHCYEKMLVTGSHAVFEDGRFIRVADSPRARRVDMRGRSIVVFPVVTEHHLLVTTTHLGADFAEIDESSNVSPPERLEALNADCDRLARLASWDQRAFGALRLQGLQRRD